jgi:DNA-binding response OmpR family regulator
MLPDGNGFELCQTIRMNDKQIPILFLTAKGSSDDIVRGLECGADDYMTKPFSLKELLARIIAMLRRSRWNEKEETALTSLSTFKFQQNIIDFKSHTITVRGHSTQLTVLELRLLEFFVSHANTIVSRQDLLEHVWNISSDVNTRTVDNFLVRLRRLFEKDPTHPQHFITVRGLGYRFVPEPKLTSD